MVFEMFEDSDEETGSAPNMEEDNPGDASNEGGQDNFIDPPAAETAAAATERRNARQERQTQQAENRDELKNRYTEMYNQEATTIQEMQTNLDTSKSG